MYRIVILAALALLASCATPQEQCINRETRDLRVLDRLIAETEGNIARGYAIEEYTDTIEYWGICTIPQPAGPDGVRPPPLQEECRRERDITRTRPKAIDLGAERQKLLSIRAKRQDLARASVGAVAACRATYPE